MNYGTSSGRQTASAQITVIPGGLMGVDVTPPSSGYSTLVVYDSDNSDTAGKLILAEVHVDAGFIGVNHEFFLPVAVNKGLYCELTNNGASDSRYYIRFLIG